MMSTEVKILHAACCGKQSPIKTQIEAIAKNNHLNLSIEELFELKDTMQYGAMTFPSIVINGKVFPYKSYQTNEKLLSILHI